MILLRFIGILILTVFTNAQSVCRTSVGETGICVPVKECDAIVDIIMKSPKPLPQKTVDYLKINYCGLQNNAHYICCSERHLQNLTSTPIVVFNENSNKEAEKQKEDKITNIEINNVADHPNLNLLPLSDCGFIYTQKIVASYGNRSLLGEFPWMAMLQYQTPRGLEFQCGGTLISSRYVLTAAHCVTGIDDILISVRLGEHNTSSELDCENLEIEPELICADPVQDIEIEEVLVHPQYNKARYANDIALIRLKKKVNLSDFIQAICMPVTEASQRQKLNRTIITGWGLTENQQTSDVLVWADIPVVSNDECQKVFRRFEISNSQICAGGENMVDSCKGDSGGPLIFPAKISNLENSFRYVQYGVTSAGASACGSPKNFPSIYAKVSFYIDWILDQLKP